MLRIRLMHYPRALASSISFPMDILQSAAAAYRTKHPAEPTALIELVHCAMAIPQQLLAQQPLLTYYRQLHQLDHAEKSDLIILPAIWRNPRPLMQHAQPLLQWLTQQYHLGASICAVGTASCFLAEAGLLDGKPATTHWFYFDAFEKAYPRVKLQRKHLITQAEHIFCAGSINAIADLSIYFSERFFGRDIARQIESHFSPEIRRPIDQQLYRDNHFSNTSDERISLLQYWLRENYQQQISLSAMAAYLQMSTRHLTRIFKRELGITPWIFLHHHRLGIAKSLLRETNLSIAEIAAQSGYEDTNYFIRLFKREIHTTPKKYRQRIRSKLFN